MRRDKGRRRGKGRPRIGEGGVGGKFRSSRFKGKKKKKSEVVATGLQGSLGCRAAWAAGRLGGRGQGSEFGEEVRD